VPDFDFLIIDESSKTTFQEFLVPALYAKRWILAGDVMQLAPFTDQETIEDNFEQMAIEGKPLDENIQQAVFILEKIKDCRWTKNRETGDEYRNRFILPCHAGVVIGIVKELEDGRIKNFTHDEIFICITGGKVQQPNFSQILVRTPDSAQSLELTAANVVFVDFSVMDKVWDKLPATHAVLGMQDWKTMPHAFYHNGYRKRFGHFQRGKIIADSFELVTDINRDFKEQSWSKEIAWCINSKNQLRLAGGNKRKKA